tara:strand:- start:3212 stop:4327 length:1116 start_codon:yes stop_codon:yes gene_type:complete
MTNNKYPNDKITESYNYIENFQNDIDSMIDILDKINIWNSRGINLESCNDPLNNQIELWKNTMDDIINEFKNNIIILKKHDDRIQNASDLSDTNLLTNIDIPEGTIMEQWKHLYDIYEKIYINLNEDINILNNALTDLNNYNKIGVELGDVNEVINTQITNITDGINESLNGLDNIINKIKDESKKILTEEELAQISNTVQNEENNYLALYARYNFSEVSSMLYFNAIDNSHLEWNAEVDGNNIMKNMTQVYLDKNSPIYDEEIGENMIQTNAKKPFKYLYYGFSKDDMNCINISQNHFVQYADQHGYQRTITIYHDTPTVHGSHLTDQYKDMFTKYGKEYKGLSTTTDKLFIIYSADEITDFTNIKIRGE